MVEAQPYTAHTNIDKCKVDFHHNLKQKLFNTQAEFLREPESVLSVSWKALKKQISLFLFCIHICHPVW